MALQKQTLPVIFSKGINQKVDEKLAIKGDLLALENRIFNKIGRLDKRYGFTGLGTTTTASDEISSGNLLDVFKNELLLMDQSQLYSYLTSEDQWIAKDTFTTAEVTSQQYVRNSNTQALQDIAYLDGTFCAVWADSDGDLKYSIYGESGMAFVANATVYSGGGTRPKVIQLGDGFLITYIRSAGLRAKYILRSDYTTILPSSSTEVDIQSSGIADEDYDIQEYTTNVGAYACRKSTGGVIVGYVDITGTKPVGYPSAEGGIITDDAVSISVTTSYATSQLIVALATTTAARIWGIDAPSLSTTGSDYDDETLETVSNIRNITCAYNDSTIEVFYEVGNGATPTTQYISYNTATWAGPGNTVVAGTPVSPLIRSVGLASGAFIEDSVVYTNTVHDSNLQPTYFTINSSGEIIAKELANIGGRLTREADGTLASHLGHVVSDNDGNFNYLTQIRNKLSTSDGTTLTANLGLNKIKLDLTTTDYTGVVLGDNYHISGGIVTDYDGAVAVEHGFHVFPEDVDVTMTTTGGSGFALGTYSFRVVYEWIDAKGQFHRSAPSITAFDIVTNATDTLTVTIPRLRLTKKSNVNVVLYATEADGTIYYRLSEISNTYTGTTAPWNGSDDDTLVFTDINGTPRTTPDLDTREILYTTGGILENIAPPACSVIHKHGNRVFIGGLEDESSFWYSKEHVSTEAIAFSDALKETVDPEGGTLTAFSTLDDKLVIFKQSAVFTMSGEGPLDSGAQNNFTQPQLVQGDVGAQNQQSVIITPIGVMFKSDKGIYILDRSLKLDYIGSPVEDYNDLTITSAAVIEDNNQVRFTTSGDVTLVYDYFFGQWSVFTNYGAQSSTIWNNTHVHLKSTGLVNQEIVDSYNDNGSKIKTKIETSWWTFKNLQDFQRIYELSFLGEYFSTHNCRIKIAYNYEPVYNETKVFASSEIVSTDTYGDDSTYGDSTVYGGSMGLSYEFEIKPRQQKCESIKLLIEDIDTGTVGGQSFSLNSCTVTVGQKDRAKPQFRID